MDGHVGGMVIFHRPQEQFLVPGFSGNRAQIVLMLQDDRESRPELLSHAVVEPAVWPRLDEDAVIFQGHTLLEGIVGDLEMVLPDVRIGNVVGDAKLGGLEMSGVDVDVFLLGPEPPLLAVFRGGQDSVSFSPHSEMADGHEIHVRIAVIPLRKSLDTMLDGLEEFPVGIFRFEKTVHLVAPGALVEDPLRCPLARPVFGRCDAKGYPFALLYPSLRGSVYDFPVELAFFRLQKSPWKPQEDDSDTFKLIYGVLRQQLRAVVVQHVRIVVEHPPHSGIDQGLSVVTWTDGDRLGLEE